MFDSDGSVVEDWLGVEAIYLQVTTSEALRKGWSQRIISTMPVCKSQHLFGFEGFFHPKFYIRASPAKLPYFYPIWGVKVKYSFSNNTSNYFPILNKYSFFNFFNLKVWKLYLIQ